MSDHLCKQKQEVQIKVKHETKYLLSRRGPIFEAGSFPSSWRARRGTSTSRPLSPPCSWRSCCSWISKSLLSLSTEKNINSKWDKTFFKKLFFSPLCHPSTVCLTVYLFVLLSKFIYLFLCSFFLNPYSLSFYWSLLIYWYYSRCRLIQSLVYVISWLMWSHFNILLTVDYWVKIIG